MKTLFSWLQDDTVVRVVKGAAKDDVQSIEVWDRVRGLVSSFNLKVNSIGIHGTSVTLSLRM